MKKLLLTVSVLLSMSLVSCSYVDKAKALVGFGGDQEEAEMAEVEETAEDPYANDYVNEAASAIDAYDYSKAAAAVEEVANTYGYNYDYEEETGEYPVEGDYSYDYNY